MKRSLAALMLLMAVVGAVFIASRRGARTDAPTTRFVPPPAPPAAPVGPTYPGFSPSGVGDPPGPDPPQIGNVRIVSLRPGAGRSLLVCDIGADRVSVIERTSRGAGWTESTLAAGDPIRAPARAAAGDMDGDGDVDVVVAVMGQLYPTDERVGAVVLLEAPEWRARLLLSGVARVTDVRPGDFDGDGDLDLAVALFGYSTGAVGWLRNDGADGFSWHELLGLAGSIDAIPVDFDSDGDLDIATVVSQDFEEVYVFEGDGRGGFTPRLVWGSANADFGSSGLHVADVDGDGDPDLLLTNGDAFDYTPPRPRPWHGVGWLDNPGRDVLATGSGDAWRLPYRRIGDLGGASAARGVDADGDGDLDVVVVSAFQRWDQDDAWSLALFEQLPGGRWLKRGVARSPTHLITLDAGDLDGDGDPDLVAGGMHVYPPYDRVGRVTLFNLDPSADASRGDAAPAAAALHAAVRAAVDKADRAVAANPVAATVGALGMTLHANELLRLAERAYADAAGLDPQDPRWPILRRHVLAQLGEGAVPSANEGDPAWLATVEAGSVDPDVLLRRAQVARRRGRVDRAENALVRAERLAPDDPDVLYALGTLRFEAGSVDGALPPLLRSAALRPDHAPVHVSLGGVYSAMRRWDLALHHYRRVLERQPNDPRGLHNVGVVLHNLGRTQQAAVWLDRARALGFEPGLQ